jgi:hypothetical protein
MVAMAPATITAGVTLSPANSSSSRRNLTATLSASVIPTETITLRELCGLAAAAMAPSAGGAGLGGPETSFMHPAKTAATLRRKTYRITVYRRHDGFVAPFSYVGGVYKIPSVPTIARWEL